MQKELIAVIVSTLGVIMLQGLVLYWKLGRLEERVRWLEKMLWDHFKRLSYTGD